MRKKGNLKTMKIKSITKQKYAAAVETEDSFG